MIEPEMFLPLEFVSSKETADGQWPSPKRKFVQDFMRRSTFRMTAR
jgi:hypothetical protein